MKTDTTPQSSVPRAPAREEVLQALASFEGCTPVAWLVEKTWIDQIPPAGYKTCPPDQDGAFPVYAAPPEVAQLQGELARLRDERDQAIAQLSGKTALLRQLCDQLAALQANVESIIRRLRENAEHEKTAIYSQGRPDLSLHWAKELGAAIAQESQQGREK